MRTESEARPGGCETLHSSNPAWGSYYVSRLRQLRPGGHGPGARWVPQHLRGAADSRIAADSVGKPVARLQEAFGKPRKIDTTPTKEVYVWFLAQRPDGAPDGFHGCELEVTVDARSEHVLGYSLSNIGWSKCREVERKIRVAER